jgi:anti-sigma factor RsiW
MSADPNHTFEWSDRLQDLLDGDASPSEAAATARHVDACGECSTLLAELRELDASLQRAAPPMTLDARFDERLYAQIHAIDGAQRIAARERIERELQENLRALSQSWRRTLAFVIPGVIAGIALAFALAGYFFSADSVQPLMESAEALSRGRTPLFEAGFTALLGATIGAFVARWLASVAE